MLSSTGRRPEGRADMPRPKIPPEQKRVLMVSRVDPETKQFLVSLGAKNIGRALDEAVRIVRAKSENR
jgi:hypothetical protein